MESNTDQLRIKNLSEKRYKLFREYEESYDEELSDYTEEFPEEIDDMADEIFEMIKIHQWNLPVEFILEELSKLGQAPCLLYDDEGHWAVAGDGIQPVTIGDPIEMEMTHFIEKDMWKDTIREAINQYLTEEDTII